MVSLCLLLGYFGGGWGLLFFYYSLYLQLLKWNLVNRALFLKVILFVFFSLFLRRSHFCCFYYLYFHHYLFIIWFLFGLFLVTSYHQFISLGLFIVMHQNFIIYRSTFLLNISLYDHHPFRNFFLLNPLIYCTIYLNLL